MSANTLASTSGNIYLQHTTNRIFPVADNFRSPTSRCRNSMPHNPPTLACPHSVPELPANITDRVNSIAYPVPYSIARGQPHGAPRAHCIDTLYSFYTPNIRYNVTYLCEYSELNTGKRIPWVLRTSSWLIGRVRNAQMLVTSPRANVRNTGRRTLVKTRALRIGPRDGGAVGYVIIVVVWLEIMLTLVNSSWNLRLDKFERDGLNGKVSPTTSKVASHVTFLWFFATAFFWDVCSMESRLQIGAYISRLKQLDSSGRVIDLPKIHERNIGLSCCPVSRPTRAWVGSCTLGVSRTPRCPGLSCRPKNKSESS